MAAAPAALEASAADEPACMADAPASLAAVAALSAASLATAAALSAAALASCACLLSPQPTTATARAAAINIDLFIIVPLLDYEVRNTSAQQHPTPCSTGAPRTFGGSAGLHSTHKARPVQSARSCPHSPSSVALMPGSPVAQIS